MKIKLNGEDRECQDNITVRELLEELGLNREGIAVAINRVVVSRGEHPTTEIHDGDAVEIIHAVGGGR
jgi:thiamine biosynthesis protein ThiS